MLSLKKNLGLCAKVELNIRKRKFSTTKPYICILEKKALGFADYCDGYIDCFYVHYEYFKKKFLVDSSMLVKSFFEIKRNIIKIKSGVS